MTETPRAPNILLITTDQQRFDTLAPWKPPFLRTPHLDNLAARGVTFANAYADCPLCVPARTSIMTGKYAPHHGMTTNGITSNVMGSTQTLPACLHERGYQTLAVGKMHFTPKRARHGFDEILLPADYYDEMRARGHDLQPMRHGLGQNELCPGMSTVPESLTHTAWVAEQSRRFIMDRRDPTRPFFLWCSFSKPHPPFDPPEPYYSMYRDRDIPGRIRGDWCGDDAPEAFKRMREGYMMDRYGDEFFREAKAAYYGLITQIDYNIGRVLAALRDGDGCDFDETLILFTSDHGEYLGDFGASAKSFFHEVSAHVPMILKVPGSFEQQLHGVTSQHLATHADILATFAAPSGTVPDDIDGIDLAKLAAGQAQPRATLDAISGAGAAGSRAGLGITDGSWKYLWFPEGGVEQLFNLAEDRYETRNLAGCRSCAAVRQRLRTALVERHRDQPYGFVADGDLATMPLLDDRVNGKRRLFAWAPGYTTEYASSDTCH